MSDRASQHVLEVRDLTRVIRGRTIVDSLTFDLREGEVFGFLGPNGAGKTTTIRMLVGLIKPTRGTIRINGYDLAKHHDDALRRVGCIVETPDLYKFMTGRENLRHFARMIGPVDEGTLDEVASRTRIEGRLDEKVSTYSLGMRQRLGIAISLLGEPSLLILDEPANGLDPVGIREIRTLVRTLARERGVTVFVSSHLLGEIQMMCDRVGIIHRGRIVRLDTVDNLVGAKTIFRVETNDTVAASRILEATGYAFVSHDGSIDVDAPIELRAELIESLVSGGAPVSSAYAVNPTLEELFLESTEETTVQ
ncbi:MAG: ABC transporter ATP-binding protein [Acidobacteria bacterium]|nr:ABC transporter ATP-binding protein [Acidobacteriota bacterium]